MNYKRIKVFSIKQAPRDVRAALDNAPNPEYLRYTVYARATGDPISEWLVTLGAKRGEEVLLENR
jgi:hypothetical protein